MKRHRFRLCFLPKLRKEAACRRVSRHMKMKYGVSLDELDISDVPGYWKDREARMHPGHPLHGCLGCSGPFKAAYTYFDPPREHGRFASPTRTWAILKGD